METIRLDYVNFSYPLSEKPALRDVTFTIQPSQFIVLCGKSGCGKSTLLRQLKKNLIPYGRLEGQVLYCGERVDELPDRKSAEEIGFVQQNPDNQIVTDKVWHELAFGLESLGLSNSAIKRRVAEMASYFGIQGWFRKNVSELSGGQKQLLNLASIMAMQPKLLILDEPASQLDPIAASEFLQTVYKINRDLGTTVLISEHRLEEVFPMADKVMVMDEGKLIAFAEPERIGEFLSGEKGGERHPMFYGLPSVTRIFSEVCPEEKSPLTIREGRLRVAQILDGKEKGREQKTEQAGKKKRAAVRKGENALSVKDVYFRYDRGKEPVLRGLSFSVRKNQWYCLLGGNGSGKSTTLKVTAGILKPQKGEVKKKWRSSPCFHRTLKLFLPRLRWKKSFLKPFTTPVFLIGKRSCR